MRLNISNNSKLKNSKNYMISSYKDRCFAFLLDIIFQIGLSFILLSGLTLFFDKLDIYTVGYILNFFIWFLNRIIFPTYRNGQSFGKRIRKIKCVKEDGKRVRLIEYILREIIYYLLFIFDIIFCLLGDKKQTAHDRMCNTLVVYTN